MHEDKNGVPFARYRELLPGRPAEWPAVERVYDPRVLAAFHWTWDWCQVCGRPHTFRTPGSTLEAHHIVGGYLRGRHDARENLIMLCRDHHQAANTAGLPLGLILWCKWRTDRLNTNWQVLALLRRQHLPDLIVDNKLRRQYETRIGPWLPSELT